MRLAVIALLAGCAELGVVGDGTSISVGKASGGFIVDGTRMPDKGDGFFTREQWRTRGNRYGTDELVDLVTAVARRMHARYRERIVVADLSRNGGGEVKAWHMSHQSGRDVDLLYYVRDKDGNSVEPDKMVVFDAAGKATDGSGQTVDVPRMWSLMREFLTAPEAPVQWLFIYEPLGKRILEYAASIREPEALLAKARLAVKQPGKLAPHDDHMHVRVYCSKPDVAYGCVDNGQMELLAARDAELVGVPYALPVAPTTAQTMESVEAPAQRPAEPAKPPAKLQQNAIGRMLRRPDHLPLRWR